MKYRFLFVIGLVVLFSILQIDQIAAQCAVCTKTAMQMGERPAKGLNTGILYLAAIPFVLCGVIGFRWWKREKSISQPTK